MAIKVRAIEDFLDLRQAKVQFFEEKDQLELRQVGLTVRPVAGGST